MEAETARNMAAHRQRSRASDGPDPSPIRPEEAVLNPTDDTSRTASAPRVVGWLALAGVSLIAGIASYFHALAVVQASGATAPVSYLVPALADLVILGASADLLAASRAGQERPRLTMAALGVGIVVTLGMNVAAADPHAVPKWLVNGWPALAFTLALESLAGLVRRGRGGLVLSPVPAAPDRGETAEAPTRDEAFLMLAATGSRKEIGDFLSLSPSQVQRRVEAARKAVRAVPAEVPPDSAEPYWDGRFEAELETSANGSAR